MGVVVAYVLAGFVSLLPRGYRNWFGPDEDLQRPALISGVLQYVTCALILLGRFVVFIQSNTAAFGASAVAQGQSLKLERAQYDLGFTLSGGYLFRPLTILLFYLTFEGVARFLAASVTREVVGTAPLYLAALAWRLCARLYSRLAGKPGARAKFRARRKAQTEAGYCPLELRPGTPPPPSSPTDPQ